MTIRTLFAGDIDRKIEEVIKVDQTNEQIIRDELNEYVVTDVIRGHYTEILDTYQETPNKPHEGIAVWVSGFFGSGKSSFAKILGLSIENRMIDGKGAAERFADRAGGDNRLRVLLSTISERIPTHTVIFDVSTDRGIRSGNQSITEIMYRQLLHSLGYATDLDLAELEITLEEKDELPRFEAEYARIFGKDWNEEKGKVAFSASEASQVMHSLQPQTFPIADSWVRAAKNRADITPGKLADRATELMRRRRPGYTLLFVIDEVGQFVARDVQKMLDLQAVVQQIGVKGRGKHWIVVTSQEKLDDLVSGLEGTRIELARLRDRFPLQVHLEPSDISEVTSKRVLTKNAAAETSLGKLFDEHRARLTQNTRLTAEIRLPELTRDSFTNLYPLVPYQVDLIIQIVSGLRTQGGANRSVGGANRTIIKLAQQLLIHPAVNIADQPVGSLVRLDQIYDLVENNIGSEIRAKIAAIPRELTHPYAHAVAKAICLLQYVRSVHRSPENIAAALVSRVTGDSPLADVREALEELERTHKVRRGDDGYRIPTPAEDDWERVRNRIAPQPGDAHRLYVELLQEFWKPQPTFTLADAKIFKAGLAIHGREARGGDLVFSLQLADEGAEFESLAYELRSRSRQQTENVFWAVPLSRAIDHEMVELFRSRRMLEHKERETKGEDTPALMAEERSRLRTHQNELRRLLRTACLSGRAYFRGNDRGPSDGVADVGKAATEILGAVLPDVYHRFSEAAAKATDARKGADALLTAHNLQGLPAVFRDLGLVRTDGGTTTFIVDGGPLHEILQRIEDRAEYGDNANGRYLEAELRKEPYGWDFEVVRLLVLALMRDERIEATSKGHVLDPLPSPESKDALSNNNQFRQASFRPRRGIETKDKLRAAEAFQDTFGREVTDITSSTAIVDEIRRQIDDHQDSVSEARDLLLRHRLPGEGPLEKALGEMKVIKSGTTDSAILAFNASHRVIKEAIQRAGELRSALTELRLHDLARARRAIRNMWPVLRSEPTLKENLEDRAAELTDLLERESFFRSLPEIDQHAQAIEAEYQRLFEEAQRERINAYAAAYKELTDEPGWHDLPEETRQDLAGPLLAGRLPQPADAPISLLRSERDASEARLRAAIYRMQQILEGERLVSLDIRPFFTGGIETEEQLKAALDGLREEILGMIGTGKKVVISS
ncbi:BREX system P-loop protein BrxC [Actinoplanes subtropicus]|uniref:BREX system P-loop protein BrxC n=1 Tax=Actinoplanes subtropicus TaxID=543632 RepID=UPI0004C3E606|nr:BREX system P-loop protein BrxC [Actinoplanes subtropicus]